MLIGITLFAAITGTITSALISAKAGSGQTAAGRLRDLAALRDERLGTDEEYALKRGRLVADL